MGALCTKEPGCGKGALATPRGSGLHTDSEPETLQTGHSEGQEGEREKRATRAQHAVTEGDWTWVGAHGAVRGWCSSARPAETYVMPPTHVTPTNLILKKFKDWSQRVANTPRSVGLPGAPHR